MRPAPRALPTFFPTASVLCFAVALDARRPAASPCSPGTTDGYFVSIKSASLPALVIDTAPAPGCDFERLVVSVASLGLAQELCGAIRTRMHSAMEAGAVTRGAAGGGYQQRGMTR